MTDRALDKVEMTLCFKAKGNLTRTLSWWLSIEFSLDAKEPRFYSVGCTLDC